MTKQDRNETVHGEARRATNDGDHDAAKGEMIGVVSKRCTISEKLIASLPLSDDGYPPNRPRPGCVDC